MPFARLVSWRARPGTGSAYLGTIVNLSESLFHSWIAGSMASAPRPAPPTIVVTVVLHMLFVILISPCVIFPRPVLGGPRNVCPENLRELQYALLQLGGAHVHGGRAPLFAPFFDPNPHWLSSEPRCVQSLVPGFVRAFSALSGD